MKQCSCTAKRKERRASEQSVIREKAAIFVQKIVRRFLAKKIYDKRKRNATINVANKSALKIQCQYRRFRDRNKS